MPHSQLPPDQSLQRRPRGSDCSGDEAYLVEENAPKEDDDWNIGALFEPYTTPDPEGDVGDELPELQAPDWRRPLRSFSSGSQSSG